MYICLILFLSLAASLPAATLIPAANFGAPTVVTFSSSGNFTSPAAYTEAGASFRETASGETIYTYSGILDPDLIGGGSASLDVIFPSLMDRFGFIANPSVFTSRNFNIASVTFYSDTAMTSVTESYTTVFSVTSSDTFFGLEQGAGSFAAVRLLLTPQGSSGFSPTIDDFRFEATGVPEPASFGLLGLGAGCLVLAWRRRASTR
ncbi:MAG: PEP-CTERM sorting domain-containing protein [Bryobacterales bacterium]|nr:PEP-CTERM sorting domain-containing protein [Bryobacterales bacterium]